MAVSILATKLYIPPPRPKFVFRPRLIDRLNEGFRQMPGITLISAPAGFGKTTLISEWVHQKEEGGRRNAPRESKKVALHPSRVAWLSLDDGDNDLIRFLTYFVVALQRLALSTVEGVLPNIGEQVLEMLQASQMQPPP